ncbi:MAG TPA: MlaD family protein [Solirubrobacteraceae bacterium]|nr:MlaD family protein [Solirubrobacteraceae bacterium]
MRRAITAHRRDFVAIVGLVVIAVAIAGYILDHQPAFTFGRSYYSVKAEFASSAAVTPGQGQAVTIAGVQVGQVGGVELQNGRAVVTMNLYKQYAPIYRDATVLLRPRTPLKDMYLALDPGTKAAGAIPDGGLLPVSATSPDIDLDQILASLDADSRSYLLLLLSGGAQAFRDPTGGSGPAAPAPDFADGSGATAAPSAAAVADLQGTFKRFAPLDRDTGEFATLLAQRSANLRLAIHNLQRVATALGGVDGQLASLIVSSNTNFAAISSQDANLEAGLSLFPSTLAQTNTTLGKVQAFTNQLGPALGQLLPFARALGPALKASRPLFHDTTPVIQTQLRPFSTAVQPLARALRPAATQLARATPPLTRSIEVVNTLFNTLAYQPSDGEQGYLFWGSWLAHIANSLTDLQDAQGPTVRGIFMATCPQLNLLETTIQAGSPSVGPLLDLLNAPDWTQIKSSYCPAQLGSLTRSAANRTGAAR